MSDCVAAQTQQTADVGRRLEMHAHEMTSTLTFASAKKGGAAVGPTRRGKGTTIMAISTAMVFLSPCTWPAFHRMSHTSSPPPSTPASSASSPPRLIGDRGYDSDRARCATR